MVLPAARLAGHGDLKHFAGAFAVAGGDDRGMDLGKAAILEELMDRVGKPGTDPADCSEGVGSRPEMTDLTKKFEGMPLLLQRIGFRVGPADQGNFGGCDFDLLALGGRRLELPFDDDA